MPYRIIAKAQDQVHRFTLHPGRNLIGSDPACAICLSDPTVSRQHAALDVPQHAARERESGAVVLHDLDSRNGTLLGTRRIRQAPVAPGDDFRVGRVQMRLEMVHEDDLQVGIEVGGDRRRSAVNGGDLPEATESFSPNDRFYMEHLPRLLGVLEAGDSSAEALAQRVGFALFDSLPAAAVEILVQNEGEDDDGVLYRGEHPDDEQRASHWMEGESGGYRVRAAFTSARRGARYQPLLDAGVRLLTLAGRIGQPAAEVPPSVLRRRATPDVIERPQPPSVVPTMQRIYEQAERVARGDVGVLISGESGTGKEVLSGFIHRCSPRTERPLVTINCASLPRDLLEAELFGVERGVATGVEARPGKFEVADQGTLFLDEIGDMAAETQAKILRVLQEKEVFRLGGHTPRPARARIVAATNRPIKKMMAEGTFRSDLYHRIATWEVELPPLRQRRADIANLAAHFLSKEAQRYGLHVPGISRAALGMLESYAWPGNVRQLRNEIARAVLFLETGELLESSRLSEAIRDAPSSGGAMGSGQALAATLEVVERQEIQAALAATEGDTAAAAERLQISRPTLYRRIKALKIDIPKG